MLGPLIALAEYSNFGGIGMSGGSAGLSKYVG